MSSCDPSLARIWRGEASRGARTAVYTVDLPDVERHVALGVPRRPVTAPAMLGVAERIEAARAEGHRRGYEEGHQAALAAIGARVEEERQSRTASLERALTAAVSAIATQRVEAVAVAEVEVVTLAIELAEALLRRELALSAVVGADALRRALDLVPAGEDLVVRLHPSDAEHPGALQALVSDRQVRVVADPAVEPGGCLVDAGPCHVDAQIAPALDRARQVLADLVVPARGAPGVDAASAAPADDESLPAARRFPVDCPAGSGDDDSLPDPGARPAVLVEEVA